MRKEREQWAGIIVASRGMQGADEARQDTARIIRNLQRKAMVRALELGGGVLDDEGLDALLDGEG